MFGMSDGSKHHGDYNMKGRDNSLYICSQLQVAYITK